MKWKNILLVVVTMSFAPEMGLAADPVTYWFGGTVTDVYNPSNAMPFNISVGRRFTARLSYDPALVGSSNVTSYPEGDIGFYYFKNTDGFSILLQIAGHTVTNINNPSQNAGLVGIYDHYNNEDSYWAETGGSLTVDGVPYLDAPLFSVIAIYLSDRSKTAFDSVAIPTNAPALDKLTNSRQFSWGAYIDDGLPTRVFSVSGVLTSVTLTEQLQLNVQPLGPRTLRLGWPVAVAGFTLRSCTNLTTKNWQTVTNAVVDINTEHTVTVSNDVPERFFQLTK